ncbi:carboxylesterase from carbohydrate esterase [Amylocystis lapponica]|nr:carboxylesterase from carbohydrate esterase [Amylocystis lapponica]
MWLGAQTLALACVLSLPFSTLAVIPSSQSFGSEITLLYNNDLDAHTAAQHKSVLLLSPNTSSNAAVACAALSETLLPVNTSFFSTDLPPLLQYQAYLGHYPESQQYWVAKSGATCQVVNSSGAVSSTSCDGEFPVLCGQSAAFRASPSASNSLTVSSNGLEITGYRDQLSFRFQGIPYVNPPQRFQYPTAYTGSPNINATAYGSNCAQTGESGSSENCLFLNIWTPYIPTNASTSPRSKPVLFWIHGGTFIVGEGSDSTYEGGNLASRGDVVHVTINYRLSTLGFLALGDGKTKGNYGIADQIAALDWVREHISAFGGDPDRITLIGQSAGAAAVRALLASPKAIGKFAAAIQMSNLAGENYATTNSLYYTIPDEVSVAVEPLLKEAGCTDSDALACLTAIDAHKLVNMKNVARYIVVDGTYIIHNELPLNGSGNVAKVHTMMGYLRDDGAVFIGYPTNDNLTEALIAQNLTTTVVNNSLFTPPTSSNATLNVFNVTSHVATDVTFRCLDQATAWSAVNHDLFESVWFYNFNRSYPSSGSAAYCTPPVSDAFPYGDPSQEYFKCHSGERYYVFGTLGDLPYRDAEDLPFMQTMFDMWTSFARTYNPNPDTKYLSVRGYSTTATQLAKEGAWTPVTKDNINGTPLRTLQWGSFQGELADQDQCKFLGYPLDYFG